MRPDIFDYYAHVDPGVGWSRSTFDPPGPATPREVDMSIVCVFDDPSTIGGPYSSVTSPSTSMGRSRALLNSRVGLSARISRARFFISSSVIAASIRRSSSS